MVIGDHVAVAADGEAGTAISAGVSRTGIFTIDIADDGVLRALDVVQHTAYVFILIGVGVFSGTLHDGHGCHGGNEGDGGSGGYRVPGTAAAGKRHHGSGDRLCRRNGFRVDGVHPGAEILPGAMCPQLGEERLMAGNFPLKGGVPAQEGFKRFLFRSGHFTVQVAFYFLYFM